MHQKKKINVVYVLLVTLTLFVSAAAMITGTRAAYRTNLSASRSVRAAAFSVEVKDPVLASQDCVLNCNEEADEVVFQLPIINRSEVETSFSVVISGYGENVSCTVEGGSGTLAANGGETSATVRFSIVDRQKKNQNILLDRIVATVQVEQKGGDE